MSESSITEMSKKVSVAIAILHQDNKFLMQLWDDIPTIWHPGYWNFLGGHIELGETPKIAVVRITRSHLQSVRLLAKPPEGDSFTIKYRFIHSVLQTWLRPIQQI